MKIKIPLILALLLAGAMAQAEPQAPLTVAVNNFKGYDEAASLGGKVTTLLTADLTTESNLVMVEREEVTRALSEQSFDISGMVSSDTAAKIGQITGAKVLVAGEVMKTGGNHLVIVATLIGTETGRLFADQAEGPADHLLDLTSELSRKIGQTIRDQAASFTAAAQESNAERVERIVKSIDGTNRPSVSVNIVWPWDPSRPCSTPSAEFGIILLKAGFRVVDARSDQKPDVEINGMDTLSKGPRHGGLFSYHCLIDLKVQERRTGRIIAFDRQESVATDIAMTGAKRAAQVNAVDALAERIVPLLAK